MRVITRKGAVATCPYCKHRNMLGDEADVCDHLYEIATKGDYVEFYFVLGFTDDIRGKRLYKGKAY